jgi:hypothetical protein
MLETRCLKAAELLSDAKHDVTTYAEFPQAHWSKIASTNPFERVKIEIRRRFGVIGIFPNDESALRLFGAVLAETHGEWQTAEKRYLPNGSMNQIGQSPTEIIAPCTPELPAVQHQKPTAERRNLNYTTQRATAHSRLAVRIRRTITTSGILQSAETVREHEVESQPCLTSHAPRRHSPVHCPPKTACHRAHRPDHFRESMSPVRGMIGRELRPNPTPVSAPQSQPQESLVLVPGAGSAVDHLKCFEMALNSGVCRAPAWSELSITSVSPAGSTMDTITTGSRSPYALRFIKVQTLTPGALRMISPDRS